MEKVLAEGIASLIVQAPIVGILVYIVWRLGHKLISVLENAIANSNEILTKNTAVMKLVKEELGKQRECLQKFTEEGKSQTRLLIESQKETSRNQVAAIDKLGVRIDKLGVMYSMEKNMKSSPFTNSGEQQPVQP